MAPPMIEDGPPVQARPGWRTVHKRPERKPRQKQITAGTPAPAPPLAIAAPEPQQPSTPAWAQWRRAYNLTLNISATESISV